MAKKNIAFVDVDWLENGMRSLSDSIREKSGVEGGLSFPDGMVAAVDSISVGGGGSVEGYATVTFMNGGEVLFSRMVLKGDDCPDPWVQKRIELPTKESTAQYDYTFNGWATADGGSADSNALKGITEDKTLYAAFASEVRYYTARLYDGATLLYTEQVAYGRKPSYVPEKDGFVFNGWLPDEVVTGDIDYTVVWKEKKALADYTWAELDAMSVDEVRANFQIGDQKLLKTGLPSYLSLTATLIGIEHDDLADGSGKAKMTFFCDKMPYIVSSSGVSVNRQFTIDPRTSYLDQTSRPNSSKFFSGRFAWDDVSEVNPFVKTVKKKYYGFLGTSPSFSSVEECEDTYFWLSLSELGYIRPHGNYPDTGEKYEYFTAKSLLTDIANDAILGTSYAYTRDPCTEEYWYCVRKGYAPNDYKSKNYYTCGFCI